MINYIIYTLSVSFIISVLLFRRFIDYLKKVQMTQIVRTEGPKTHHSKQGTPTMGGVIIIITLIITLGLTSFVFHLELDKIFLLSFPIISFGIIGYLDDYLIVVKKKNYGLSGRLRLLLEVLISSIYFSIYLRLGFPTNVNVFGYLNINITWFYGLLILLMLVSTSNAVNLTDGLDGLAGGLVIIALLAFMYLSYYKEDGITLVFTSALVGSILGFLIFNKHPAKIFMGDTGSLALGASLASISIVLGFELLLLIIGFIFIVETLSVIIQVIYFKRTKGKRIFKMTPLHHHYELSGYSEKEVVRGFYLVGLIFSIIGVFIGVYLF